MKLEQMLQEDLSDNRKLVYKIMDHVWGKGEWDTTSPAVKYWLRKVSKEKHSLDEWKKIAEYERDN